MERNARTFLKSFQTKVSIFFILAMLFSGTLSNFLIYKFALDSQFFQLREKLKVIAQTAALMIDTDNLVQIPLAKEGIRTPQYKSISEQLKTIRKANAPLAYIYIMSKTNTEGTLQFVVDADLPNRKEIKQGITYYPGDKYDAARFPEMLKAFSSPAADKKIGQDQWGIVLSGYAPIRNKSGVTVAILGVDIFADDVYRAQKVIHQRALIVLFLSVILSLFLGMLISKSITYPIKKLVQATSAISKGNLKHKVQIRGANEINELARSFNEMADSLYRSKEKLHDYFYNVMHSFVRILEAKDRYTKGHSERVADYALKIGSRMSLNEEKLELLKDAALLHDIGKLGVEEKILNKKEKLTDQEWEVIKRHTVIGEEILKPIALSEEMLSVVRSHHERCDGKGYPDQLTGENISLFVAIVSVADAFDAMTSQRAYREAVNEKKVIQELEDNKGAQFNSDVVDILIQILQEDKDITKERK